MLYVHTSTTVILTVCAVQSNSKHIPGAHMNRMHPRYTNGNIATTQAYVHKTLNADPQNRYSHACTCPKCMLCIMPYTNTSICIYTCTHPKKCIPKITGNGQLPVITITGNYFKITGNLPPMAAMSRMGSFSSWG